VDIEDAGGIHEVQIVVKRLNCHSASPVNC
jgi:hypothetical protein